MNKTPKKKGSHELSLRIRGKIRIWEKILVWVKFWGRILI